MKGGERDAGNEPEALNLSDAPEAAQRELTGPDDLHPGREGFGGVADGEEFAPARSAAFQRLRAP
jgi:hypothetical protein